MNLSLIGLQLGDEGKGKIIDFLSNYSDINIRYNGGHNAGHIIYVKKIKKKVRILPSAIFKKKCLCLISNNIILSLYNFIYETKNIIFNNLIVSKECSIINNFDELIDFYIDKINKIGTTYNGISICYLRKYIKISFSIFNSINLNFIKIIKKNIFFYNLYFIFFKIKIKINLFFFICKIKYNIFFLKKIIVNNIFFTNNKYNKIFESSQGAMLDFNYGYFPFVTCSNIINKSVYIDSEFYLNNIKFITILKIYISKVGNGFFLTKFKIKKNFFFSLLTKEFGTNSLKIRKCGWNDLYHIKEMIKINNISNIILTKLDVIYFLKYLKILIYYKINNKCFNYKKNFVYKKKFIKFNSWKKNNKKYFLNELNFHLYIKFYEICLNTPITIISIGKHEHDLILL
ncbi:MAG: adenylosuccinate synthetase [Candidatus Carsonella ruddii]